MHRILQYRFRNTFRSNEKRDISQTGRRVIPARTFLLVIRVCRSRDKSSRPLPVFGTTRPTLNVEQITRALDRPTNRRETFAFPGPLNILRAHKRDYYTRGGREIPSAARVRRWCGWVAPARGHAYGTFVCVWKNINRCRQFFFNDGFQCRTVYTYNVALHCLELKSKRSYVLFIWTRREKINRF